MPNDRTEKRRAEILSASLDVFADKGYHAAKIADIAHVLGIGHGTFYRYFKNKRDIFDSVVDQVFDRIREVIRDEDPRRTGTSAEYREQILIVGKSLYNLFSSDPRLARILFYEALGVDQELTDKMDQIQETISLYAEQYLANGVNKGFLKKDLDIPILAKAIRAMILEGAKDIMGSRDWERTSDRWIEAICLLMLNGMEA